MENFNVGNVPINGVIHLQKETNTTIPDLQRIPDNHKQSNKPINYNNAKRKYKSRY